MKNNSIVAVLIVIASLNACKKNECGDNPQPNPGPTGIIRFDSLAVGQKSRYLGLTGESYNSNNSQFQYSDDTLELVIAAQDNRGFLVKEKLHYQGDVSDWFKSDKDQVYQYYLNVSQDTLRITPESGNFVFSRIFGYVIGRKGLPLKQFDTPELSVEGWKTNLSYCECRQSGYTENYTQFGANYPRLNVLVENSDMALDGNGETYLYTAANGIVRFSTYSWWTQNGVGWDLLP